MIDYERKSFWIAVGGFVLAIIGVVYGKLAYDASWAIAIASGSFDKSEVSVGIGRWEFLPTSPSKILVGFKHVQDDNPVVIGSIPFFFGSKGKKTVESLTVTFHYPEVMRRSLLESLEIKKVGGFGSTEVQKSYTENGKTSFVSYRIPNLNPGTAISIQEPTFLKETVFRLDAPGTTKDGIKIKMEVTANYSILYNMTVSAKDSEQQVYSLSLDIREAESMQKLKEEALHSLVKTERQKIRKALGYWQYLSVLLSPSKLGRVYLVYVPTKEIIEGDAKVHAVDGVPQMSLAQYPLADWAELN
jgi:hypothetical protein